MSLLSSCEAPYKGFATNHVVQEFNDKISFRIDSLQEGYTVYTGNGYFRVKKGNKFVFLFITFKNNSEEKQDLNLGNISLVDVETRTKYKLEFNMGTGMVNSFAKQDSFIKGQDSKERKLVFAFPDGKKPEYLLVDNKVVQISYL